MSTTPPRSTLLDELDARQNEVLDQLDRLEQQVRDLLDTYVASRESHDEIVPAEA